MNKEIIKVNDKVIVEDEMGNKKEVNNYDNIEKILESENIIESLEDKRKSILNNISSIQSSLFLSKKGYKFEKSIQIIGTIILGAFSLIAINGSSYTFNLISKIIIFLISTLSFYGISNILVKFGIKTAKMLKNTLYGYEVSLECVEKDLDKEKEKLEKLNNEKENITLENNQLEIVKLNNEKINDYDSKYEYILYSFSDSYDYLVKWYKEGILKEKENEEYTVLSDEEIDLIEDKVKENLDNESKEKVKRFRK